MKQNQILLAVIASLLVLLITGCGSVAQPPSSMTSNTTPISATLLPDKGFSRVSEFQSKANLSPAGAAFLAATKLEITSTSKGLYQFKATFPTNTPAEMTIRLTPNQKYTPTAAERAASGEQALNVSLTHSVKGDNYSLKLQYFLPNGVLPLASNMRPNTTVYQPLVLRSGNSPRIQSVVYQKSSTDYGTRLLGEGSGEESGVMVTFEAMIEAAGKEFIGEIESGAWEEMGSEGSPIKTATSTGLEVIESLGMSREYQEYVSQLDELEVEANYPTNALTQKAYAEDPGVKQQILDEIADARSELQWDTALEYLSTEVGVALELVESPALSVAVAPVVKWNKETAKQLIEERIENIRKMIARGSVNTDKNPGPSPKTPTSTATPTPTPSSLVIDLNTPKPGQWTGTYQGTHKTSIPGGATINFTDRGTFTFTVKNGEVQGTGNGHLVFHSQSPGGGYGDGETGYTFPISGTVTGGKLEFNMEDFMPDPPIFTVIGVSPDGHRETLQQPTTAPFLNTDGPLDLKHSSTKKTNIDDNEGGMQITFTGIITLD